MRPLLFITVGLVIAWCIPGEASAQIKLKAWVMANGGGTCVCTSHKTDCTIGEPMTGWTIGTNGMQGVGFWGPVVGSPATHVETLSDQPLQFALKQNYPNPFNPSTVISWTLPTAGHVRIAVFDILGKEVTVLVNEMKEAGTTSVTWDAAGFPSGVYIYRMTAPGYTSTQKMVLLH